MFKEFLKRQLVEDVISFRFFIYTLIILVTLIVFPLIFAGRHQSRLEKISQNTIENRRRLEVSAEHLVDLLGTQQKLYMEPRTSRFIADGHEEQMPQGFMFTMMEIRLPAEPNDSGAGILSSPDLSFIIQFVFSFFALILTFNAVSAEKEKGTLRLIFANSIERAKLLLAKYLAALLTVGIPFLAGLMISLILLDLKRIPTLSGSFCIIILLFFLLSLLYLSFFILLGLFFSTAAVGSKNSLVLCLLSWVFVVVILPKAAGPLLNLKNFAVPTEKAIEEAAEQAYREVWDRHASENIMTGDPNWESTKLNVRISNEAGKVKQEIYDLNLRKKIQAVKTLMAVNCVSPASLYEYAASAAAGTGLPHFERFQRQVTQYQNDLLNFFKAEDMKDKESPHLFFHPDYVSSKPVDFNRIPQFKEQKPELLERIQDAAAYGAGLILYNIIMFAIVFYKFQTYDVR